MSSPYFPASIGNFLVIRTLLEEFSLVNVGLVDSFMLSLIFITVYVVLTYWIDRFNKQASSCFYKAFQTEVFLSFSHALEFR